MADAYSPRGDTTVAPATARYRVTFSAQDAEDRPLAISAVPAQERLLGLERDATTTREWDVEHVLEDMVDAQHVSLTLPDLEAVVRLAVTVRDARAGDSASAERMVELYQRP